MAVIFIEGFEKYGPVVASATPLNSTSGNMLAQSSTLSNMYYQGMYGEWPFVTVAGNQTMSLVTGRAGAGTAALSFLANNSNGVSNFTRNLTANYPRVICGFAIMTALVGSVGVAFNELGVNNQCSIWINSSGQINVSRGYIGAGTILYTSTQTVTANSWHYLEIDLTVNNTTGQFTVWLDGVQITSTAANQNTRGATNNYTNQVTVGMTATTNAGMLIDDMYLFDNTGSLNNTARGDSTVETIFPTSDSSVAFAASAYAIGNYVQQTTGTSAPGANILALVPVIPTVSATVNSIGILPQATSFTALFKGVIYSDNSNAPGSLLSSGTQVANCTAGLNLTLPLVTPQALTGGTRYWIGYITDTSIVIQKSDITTTVGQTKANTYTGGAPAGPLSGMTTAQPTWAIWGVCTGTGNNYSIIDNKPAALAYLGATTLQGYVSSSNVNDEDLYGCNSLSNTPATIGCVKVSTFALKLNSGTRTFNLRVKTGTTTGSGNTTSNVPINTGSYYSSYFETDPDTLAAWGASGVNNLKAGVKIIT